MLLTYRPLKIESEEKKKFSQPEVCFSGGDQFDPLVLTGVCVTYFLKIANFDLIFYTEHMY
jgi:hypothetical protein